ncbi:MAG TPA: hypothetical protein VHE61_21205, partial [Opitutaceae bacterium]|nr:hypothetical protein [Opitutaceae bacterium]
RERVFLRKTVVVLEYRYLLNQLTDLDPAQLQRIRDLLLEREGILDDVFRAALRLGVHDQAEVTAEDAEQIRLVDQQIALTAGPDGAKVLTLLPLSRVMSFVQSAVSPLMYFADTPLSPAQQIQLGTLFAQVHFASGDTESKRMMLLPIDAAGGFHGVRLEMVREAQAFLSPAQLQVLDDQLRTTELSIRRPPPRAP